VKGLHIAGHARSEGWVLVTNKLSEFVRVPALEVENWFNPAP
jgi:tRNA(fMet)-specific endonuclease VapC